MIINYDSPGQLCNRIWSLIPSIAYGLKYEEKVLVINFDEYLPVFSNLNRNKLIRFKSKKLLQRIFLSLKARGYIQNGRSNVFRKLFNLNLIEGWSNRLGNREMVIEQSDNIRPLFDFRKDVVIAVNDFLSSQEKVVIVGVHIRRGDYKEWLDGIYYFSDEAYSRAMKDLEKQLLERGEKFRFLICSNERIDLHNFSELDCFVIPESSSEKELYALSKSDYIIGPPSSFSQWASFYGKVPVCYMMCENQELKLSDFSRIISFNTFENGNILDID
ncbi:alpha-1,2-fucosyltransferase [Dysgonomonas mossii]|uniref:Alpha-1,2-fucosyltransferase n=1 Tax=Dysgonomonas mossii TaxID=163665 RepID=A0A4Y9IL14_9BACT|nr:alpha-1,2-fucosyltransferase [Dysgonomonas mossii]MBF0761404.1 alpha-1,2-fucosyltransferase [Dysgonomonas mossii]TFU89041.1 hypothetical protein E4T88_10150 [Dysgonomonas mossii]